MNRSFFDFRRLLTRARPRRQTVSLGIETLEERAFLSATLPNQIAECAQPLNQDVGPVTRSLVVQSSLYDGTYAGGFGGSVLTPLTGSEQLDVGSLITDSSMTATVANGQISITLPGISNTPVTGPFNPGGNGGSISFSASSVISGASITISYTGSFTTANGLIMGTGTWSLSSDVPGLSSVPGTTNWELNKTASASRLATSTAAVAAMAGDTIPSFTVSVQDSTGSIFTSDTSAVTLSIVSGPPGGEFAAGSSITVNASSGVATFSNVKFNVAGKYVLRATDGNLVPTQTGTITVAPQAASKLVITTTQTLGAAGTAFGYIVRVQDALGNNITTDKSVVTASIVSGPATGFSPKTTHVINAVAGVADFNKLILTRAGNYILRFTDGTLAAATTVTVTVAPAAAAKVVIIRQPSSTGTAGQILANQPLVMIQDKFGNCVSSSTSPVVLSISSPKKGGAFTSGATLTVNANGGVAVFSGVSLQNAGTYLLKATVGKFKTVSTSIVVSPNLAAFDGAYTGSFSGNVLTPITGNTPVSVNTLISNASISAVVSGGQITLTLPGISSNGITVPFNPGTGGSVSFSSSLAEFGGTITVSYTGSIKSVNGVISGSGTWSLSSDIGVSSVTGTSWTLSKTV